MAAAPTVYVVDDEPRALRAMRALAKSTGLAVRTFTSVGAFLDSISGDECGCVLVDFRLRDMDGLNLLGALRQRNSALMAIVTTGHPEIVAAVECMKLGAMDFLEKPLDDNLLLVKIEEAVARSQSVRLSQAQAALGQGRLTTLTVREREILRMLVAGKSSKQIAVATRLSLKTVSNHRAHLLAKTGAGNTAGLVRIAMMAEVGQTRRNIRKTAQIASNTHT